MKFASNSYFIVFVHLVVSLKKQRNIKDVEISSKNT